MADLILRAVRALLAEAREEQDLDDLVDRMRARFRESLDRVGDDSDR